MPTFLPQRDDFSTPPRQAVDKPGPARLTGPACVGVPALAGQKGIRCGPGDTNRGQVRSCPRNCRRRALFQMPLGKPGKAEQRRRPASQETCLHSHPSGARGVRTERVVRSDDVCVTVAEDRPLARCLKQSIWTGARKSARASAIRFGRRGGGKSCRSFLRFFNRVHSPGR